MTIPRNFWERKVCMDSTLAIRENGTGIVGIANMSIDKHGASLDCLAIDPAYQGHGIGASLLRDAEKTAAGNGAKEMRLMTEQTKPSNISFYSKHGYLVTGIDPRAYASGPGIKFEKKIDHVA
jgi:ribosomal protein S18 acetylase RimI-like enzyme